MDPAVDEEIALVPYDPRWPARFQAEREHLRTRFPELLQIEHFGSTAVPGMIAKPIVDMLAGVASMSVADRLFEPILDAGYRTSRAFNAMLKDRRWFMRVANGRRSHHLHVVALDSPQWVEHLRFRDALRSHPDLAAQYGALKQALAAQYRHDREAHTEAKAPFAARVLAGG